MRVSGTRRDGSNPSPPATVISLNPEGEITQVLVSNFCQGFFIFARVKGLGKLFHHVIARPAKQTEAISILYKNPQKNLIEPSLYLHIAV